MATRRDGAALRQLQVLFSVGAFGALTDEQLLARFRQEDGLVDERGGAPAHRAATVTNSAMNSPVGDSHLTVFPTLCMVA